VPPGWQPEIGLPDRPIAQKPRWPHPNFWWAWLWCFLFLFATQIPGAVIAVVVVGILAVVAPEQFPKGALANQTALLKSQPMSVALAVAFFITELLVIGFSLLVIRLVIGRDWMRQLAVRRPGIFHTILTLASFPALVLLGNLSYEVLRNVLHLPSVSDFGLGGMEEMVRVFNSWPAPFAVLVIGLGPGIGEELWCRGFLGRGLVGRYGVVWGVLFTSFFFGFIHLDPCQGTMAILMGIWLHFVYLTTRSLWLPMLLHFLNNSLAVVSGRSPTLSRIEENAGEIPILVFVAAGLLLAGVGYALYQSRARLRTDSPEQSLWWRPAYPGVEYPPAGSGMSVVHPEPTLLPSLLAAGGFFVFASVCTWAILKH
jgi:membrane protease YdiL (CAAX protease family)